jgi:hypothetical protein
MAYPERYHIEALRKLRGDAYVSYPTSDLTKKVVERIYSVPREKIGSPDAFNSPQTDEYTDTKLIEQHFTGGDANYVEVYQKWETLPGTQLLTRTIGAINLMPEKYRRLVRTVETTQPVGPDYVFPSGLTGDQTLISLAAETLAKLRLRIVEEIIDTDEDPLIGAKFGDWGPLAITEEVVVDGTAASTGFNIVESTVTPIGNGKSIKITVSYPDASTLSKVNKSIGQDNLIPAKYRRLVQHAETISWKNSSFVFPTSLSGNQTLIELQWETLDRARYKIVEEIIGSISTLSGAETDEYGIDSITESIVDDGTAPDEGYLIKKSEVTPLGNGKSVKITVTYPAFPTVHDYDIDEETGQTIHTTYQVVDAATAGTATASSGVVTRYKHIDKWRSMKIIATYSTPASYEEQRFGAHNFPTLWGGFASYSDACGHFVGLRGGFSAMVQIRVVITYTTTKQVFAGLTLKPGTLIMGKGLQITDALFNAGSFTYFGSCAGTVSWSATSPSYTGYSALIGTEQLVTGESVKTKAAGGLYRNQAVYVTML